MQTDNTDKVKQALKKCDELFAAGKYQEALSIASAPENQKAPSETLPYVLEMQIRNLMALLQFDAALKLLEQVLQYLPELRDFLLRKAQCQIALARSDEAQRTLDDFSKKMEAKPTGEDQVWKDRIAVLRLRLHGRQARDLAKIRVRFTEDAVKEARPKAAAKKIYEFSQNQKTVFVTVIAKTGQTASEVGIEMLPKQVKLAFTTPEGKTFLAELDLCAEIRPKDSLYDVKDGVVSLELAKRDPGAVWPGLEAVEEAEDGPSDTGLTNTKKPWDQLCTLQ